MRDIISCRLEIKSSLGRVMLRNEHVFSLTDWVEKKIQ
jgi:hypothetical protein